MSTTPEVKRAFYISTFGCPKNLVDSEHLAGRLCRHGWRRAQSPTSADLLVVNTCGFIEDAQRESIEALLAACALKDLGKVGRVVAAGCLVQLEGVSLCRHMEQLDLAVGVNDWPRLPELLESAAPGGQRRLYRSTTSKLCAQGPRRELRGTHVRYIKIAEGCDCGCGFCVIPRIRGPQRSASMASILDEARQLLRRGAKELILVAQDTTAYGRDRGTMDGLPELLRRMADVVGANGVGERWIRPLYLNPIAVTDDLIRALAARPVLPYFDLALQHASPRVLARMKRAAPSQGWKPLIERIRASIPEATIRATVLLGHPGETATDFKLLVKFLEWADLDRVGIFTFSAQPGTPSATMRAPDADVVCRRRDELERLLAEQAANRVERMRDRQLLVLVDGAGSRGEILARPWTDAPDIDWTYHVPVDAPPGTFVEARVVGGIPGSVELEPLAD